ncbi:TMV resistance protein N-like [Eucalyptus grandis]|uniref:TMV resistance protein N-like n=1 Tax=Eucalyptus grandis TaxID=71139 RepID=UPI00192EBA2B|nr:TMV resistance protein N-like [Eucalyptus grandis]
MHDQLRDLGRQIVQQEDQKNPEKRSRIWNCKEILGAIETEQMKKEVVALDLDLRKSYSDFVIKSEEIGRFKSLKYLKLNGEPSWNVVVLQFSNNDFIDDSKLQSFVKMARKLKVLSLKGCDKITRTPDFFECPNLESLDVDRCSNLREIDGSIGKLSCLIGIKIVYCPCLEFLPEDIGDLVKLEHFTIQRCDGVKRLPESIWKLKSLREVHFSTGWDSYLANS